MLLPKMRSGQFLGKGSQKEVVAEVRDGVLVAVMRGRQTDLAQEATTMAQVTSIPHAHLLPLLDVETCAGATVIVAPLMPFGSMLDLADHLDFEGLSLSFPDVCVALLQDCERPVALAQARHAAWRCPRTETFLSKSTPLAPLSLRVLGRLWRIKTSLRGTPRPRGVDLLARELHTLVSR